MTDIYKYLASLEDTPKPFDLPSHVALPAGPSPAEYLVTLMTVSGLAAAHKAFDSLGVSSMDRVHILGGRTLDANTDDGVWSTRIRQHGSIEDVIMPVAVKVSGVSQERYMEALRRLAGLAV